MFLALIAEIKTAPLRPKNRKPQLDFRLIDRPNIKVV